MSKTSAKQRVQQLQEWMNTRTSSTPKKVERPTTFKKKF
jgi:hypothetical protein